MPTSNSRVEYIDGHLADPLRAMDQFLSAIRTIAVGGSARQHPNGTKMR
jgi:hypothetical protein